MPPDAAVIEALKNDPAIPFLRRSLDYYYGDPEREAGMDACYARFVRPGDLVFDIGSHVGDRIGAFRRLGARVVAVEPQPGCMRALRSIYAGDEQVALVEAACGDRVGKLQIYVNTANPTVSTASPDFVRAADGAAGWEGQSWDSTIEVPATTVDALIAQHGVPQFVKIDVEGFERVALAGLSQLLPAMSFEFTTIERKAAEQCLERAVELGFAGFDVSIGENMTLNFGRWVSVGEMVDYISSLPHAANAGDIYCAAPSFLPHSS